MALKIKDFVPNAEDTSHKLCHGRRCWTQRGFTALQEQDPFDKICQCNFFYNSFYVRHNKSLRLACILKVIITVMTSVLKRLILWHFKPYNLYSLQQYFPTLKQRSVGPEPFLRLQQHGNLPLYDVVNTD
jgi:hypothetical protein